MSGFAQKIENSKEAGLALIWVLMVLAVTSALSLAFLQKVSIGISTTGSRSNSIQAQYLAEAAANHALWRLLNEPGFPASETVYYMHDLGSGRYGYKVRQPTLTKFGTTATVGGAGNTVTKQSYVQYLKPYNIITAYGRSADQIPEYRRLLGATWVDAADTVDIGSDTVKWMVLKGAPHKKEMIMGTLDTADDINFTVWDGTSWGNLNEFTTSSNSSYKDLDIAYENLSGNGLVVGRFATGDVRYNIWNGNAWVFGTAQTDANLNPSSSIYYIDMASKPNSDEIMIALAQWGNDLQVVQWDGSAFNDLGEIDTDMDVNEYGSVAVVYEQQSGDALILWNNSGNSQVYYAVWNGTALSATAQLPDFGAIPHVIRAAADPTSDYIFVAAVDANKDLNVAVWNGDAWTDSLELETGNYADDKQIFDIAWEHSGEDVIIAWAPGSGENVHYFKWPKGTALADHSVQNGPVFQNSPILVRLLPIAGTNKIVLLVKDDNQALSYSLWTGSAFSGDPAILLESDLGVGPLPFDVAESSDDPVGAPENQPPAVAAGDDQTVMRPTQANLDGTVSDDGLPSPPGAFTTTWSKRFGPGNVTFGDASQVDTTADFSAKGEYVLRLTADDGELTAYDDVTVTVEIAGYVERYEEWQIGVADSWQVKDLSGDPFLVPANAVVEVAVINSNTGRQRWGGVRAVGSTLERRLYLHEAESGGVDALVMHVQADANSQIECYADRTNEIKFVLLGFWNDGTYVERWDQFNAVNPVTWVDQSLAPFGVGADQVAEMTIVNKNTSLERYGGVRTDGSSLDRKLYLQNAESGGVDTAGMMVKAGSTASALIEVWADQTSDIDFYLAGYWSDPPGTFTEAFTDLGSATADQTWQDKDLTGFGVPAETVVQIALSNEDISEENEMGVREQGSSLSRFIDLHEPEDGGGDIAVMHVNADENSVIEWYHQDVSDPHDYHLLGYWDIPEIILEANFDTDEEGFAYLDDTFRGTGGSASAYASGNYEAAGGYNGGGLKVLLGGINDDDILGMSGGWQQTFNLAADAEITISFRYKLTLSSEYEIDEYGQVMVSVDGTLYGEDPNDYVTQINGNGNGGSPDTSGWQLFTKNIGTLSSGDHTIIIGGYNNKKTLVDEIVDILIDDVIISQ